MSTSLSIGEFARLTHLSVKTLRHYHDIGVLPPADIDARTGYRRYGTDQVGAAHRARRLRDLEMPLAEVRRVLEAPDEQARNASVVDHLRRMEARLASTQQAVSSLRTLLEAAGGPVEVHHRHVPPTPSLSLAAHVQQADIGAWCATTFPRLERALAACGARAGGPGGALYSQAFFEQSCGHIVAFVPTREPVDAPEGVDAFVVPEALLALSVHRGPFEELDRTYGALGTHVARNGLGTPGPVREHYLVSPADTDDPSELRTEVCWPITLAPSGPLESPHPHDEGAHA